MLPAFLYSRTSWHLGRIRLGTVASYDSGNREVVCGVSYL